jgi:hypothetical protein
MTQKKRYNQLESASLCTGLPGGDHIWLNRNCGQFPRYGTLIRVGSEVWAWPEQNNLRRSKSNGCDQRCNGYGCSQRDR